MLRRRFAPADVERLTGVSGTLQRKWVQLHFASVSEPSLLWTSEGPRGHRRFTWAGVQMFEFLSTASDDLGRMHPESHFAAADKILGEECTKEFEGVPPAHLFEVDFRQYDRGDEFLILSMTDGQPGRFLTASHAGVAKVLTSKWGARLYCYNVSAMQRALVSRVAELDEHST